MLSRLQQLVVPFFCLMQQPERPAIPTLFPRGEYHVPTLTWEESIQHTDGIEVCLWSEVSHYKRKGDKEHGFIIAYIQHPSSHVAVLCADRVPECSDGSSGLKGDAVALASSAKRPAYDRVMVSYDGT
jgi:hypothetical protein